jgi:hypothetical protein
MMTPPKPPPTVATGHANELDPSFQQATARLYQLTVYGRWLLVSALWLTLGAASLWGLRYPITLLQDHFTWSALRYGLADNTLPAIGIGICIGLTLAILFWQSRNILFGLPDIEQARLYKTVAQIKQQGQTHPLWKWVWK